MQSMSWGRQRTWMNLWVFFSSVFPFKSNTKGSRKTDGEDTDVLRCTSALPGDSLVAIITFQYLQTFQYLGLGRILCTK